MIINELFSSVPLTEKGKDYAKAIEIAFTNLLMQLEDILPQQTREFSIVKTKTSSSNSINHSR